MKEGEDGVYCCDDEWGECKVGRTQVGLLSLFVNRRLSLLHHLRRILLEGQREYVEI